MSSFKKLELKELITYIVTYLVDNPDKIHVNELYGEQSTIVELKVAAEDLGKVIGKEGRTAKALRVLVHAAATKYKKRAVLEILES